MLGLILSGGESSRMGRDKGMIPYSAKPWVLSAIEKMQQLPLPVIVSVNAQQLENYAVLLKGVDVQLLPDDATIPIKGPLAGILNAHLHNPNEDLLVLACDMPLIAAAQLYNLQKAYLDNPSYHGYVYTLNGTQEPLCSIYTIAGLQLIADKYRHQALEKHSMKYMLEQLTVFQMPVPQEQAIFFSNVNTPEVLDSLGLT